MGKYQIVINRLKVNSRRETAYYASEMMNHPFSEKEGWGYTDVLRVEDSISATLQKRISASYRVWNEELQQVEKQNRNTGTGTCVKNRLQCRNQYLSNTKAV